MRSKALVQSVIISVAVILLTICVCANHAQAQYWQALPPYNLLWPLWSPPLESSHHNPSPVPILTDLPLVSECDPAMMGLLAGLGGFGGFPIYRNPTEPTIIDGDAGIHVFYKDEGLVTRITRHILPINNEDMIPPDTQDRAKGVAA